MVSSRYLPPDQWYAYLTRNRLRILMYHSISDNKNDPLAVRPEIFADELDLLARRGYCAISLAEAVQRLNQGARVKEYVCLTFDDGYHDFITTALPVLQRYGFQATLFVVAGHVGETSLWSSYGKRRPLLDWAALQAISQQGHEIGSHTLTHPDLRALPLSVLRTEVAGSKHRLEDALQQPVTSFAYPGGTFAAREVEAVAEAGYTAAAIVGGRWGNGRETSRLRLRREKMLGRDTLTDFQHKALGHYEPFLLWSLVRSAIRGAVA